MILFISALSWCSVGGNKDERFASNPARVRHRELLLPLITEALQAWRGLALAEALEAVGVSCEPINNLAQVFADPQVQAREMRVDDYENK